MALPVAVAGADVTVAQGALPVAAQTFDAAASIPGTGGAAIVAWSWTLLDKPVGSAASLLNANAQVVTLQDADTWGNYLLQLVVDDNLGARSIGEGGTLTDNPLLAPDSARVTFRVTATNTGLQKPAAGERNAFALARAETGVVDALKVQVDGLAVPDLVDVGAATTDGPALDRLTNGSYATDDGTATGVPMHLHPADTLGVATTTAAGAVLLAEAPADPANPKAVTVDRFALSASTRPDLRIDIPPGDALYFAWFSADTDFTITSLTVALRDGGTVVGGGYRFQLLDWNGVTVADTGMMIPGADNAPTTKRVTLGAPLTVPLDKRFGVTLHTQPAAGIDRGFGLTATLWAQRAY